MAYRQASAFVNQFFDTNGQPLAGGTLKSYLAGTTTTTAMFTDASGTSAGGTITLNSRGEPEVSSNTVNIWLDEGVTYKFVLADSAGTSIWTVDNINVGIASGALDILGAAPLINFKTSASESYDTRIAQIANGLAFYTGGNGATVLGMLLDQNRNLLLDPAGAGGSPSAPLHVKGATADYPIKLESTDSKAGVQFADNATTGVVGVAAVGDNLVLDANAVGIGTTSPSRSLYVQESGTGSSRGISINTATAGGNAGIGFATGGTDRFSIDIVGSAGSEALRFYSWTSSAERMRIDSSGDLLVGKTYGGALNTAGIELTPNNLYATSDNSVPIYVNRKTSNGDVVQLRKDNTVVGSISVTGSATSYNTSSDERLKENVKEIKNATKRLLKLKPYRFNFKADPDTVVDGFLAHEAQQVVRESVTGEKDGMRTEEYIKTPALGDIYIPEIKQGIKTVVAPIQATPHYYDADGNLLQAAVEAKAGVYEKIEAEPEKIIKRNAERPEKLADGQQWRQTSAEVKAERTVPDYQGIDQAKLVPLLVATIQELEARITALEAK